MLRRSARVALSLLACVPAAGRAQAIDEATLVSRLGTTLDSVAASGAFSGVVVLAKGETPVFQRAYGFADRERRVPNDLDTHFNIGSLNKNFTGTAIAQLAAAGKLDLDAPIARYWPDYPNADVARRVTIGELLAMRSGIGGDIFRAPPGGSRHDVRHNRDYVPLFAREPLEFDPGTRQRYSNAGFVVLGALVERVSGEDYYDYVREHVFRPAGMTQTASWSVDSLPPNTAIGYTRQIDYDGDGVTTLHPNAALLPGRGSAAGGGYSTAADLLRYLSAVASGRLPRGVRIPAGGAPGVNVAMDGALPDGYRIVVLANLDPPAAQDIAGLVRGWLGAHDQGR
ncbi:beta-lactamase (plasmid) [Gemmatirosa kalamazoonensis]|uniref:Beta-lactamase n=1 Tax=Gemmatirosa kalamazoonensis TaxID=861299 RepID=W0RUR7_9BACT|nr:serine hydrolase domain-containing protein [Gemmatirosa kalamazoonensis]AHG93328.1 beta-lactamase [Gemmatirosa kalamazoonensis]